MSLAGASCTVGSESVTVPGVMSMPPSTSYLLRCGVKDVWRPAASRVEREESTVCVPPLLLQNR